jgi:hypothetical protein
MTTDFIYRLTIVVDDAKLEETWEEKVLAHLKALSRHQTEVRGERKRPNL